MRKAIRIGVLVAVIGVSGTAAFYVAKQENQDITAMSASAATPGAAAVGGYSYERLAAPARTIVRDSAGTQLASFTDGSRTVMLTGRSRTFTEPKFTEATITSSAWIRFAPQAWKEGAEKEPWARDWLSKAVSDTSPDLLAIALQYTDGSAAQKAKKLRIAGDASFGPDSAEGRLEKSDFYDFLGVDWDFPDKHEKAEPARFGSLDCSGFVRMVYGYRAGYPLLGTNTKGPGLPRRAWAMSELGPGTPVVADTGKQATDYSALQPGDVLFFNLEPHLGPRVSHTGIYLGIDNDGKRRVLSSRKVANGPTFGDAGGVSLIDGEGTYAKAFRAAKRL
ncbi:NlpC/P60 family protein [Amycolatopsis roodepoortensis]|uniref:Cell wall-associated NlpC family hydrolase n=1 Tax=Amycolatopsis roodepoortensis TaxID=700274 RepID=A0ABR9KYQ0_9PSEU|nr:NlpC/P60 family protein [Amycolatopsis roodepoortensis]MBE1573027.1 cell wall-associated NlpC family hydrolase [Amycolatopsis roodepoortensis]